MSAAQFWQTFEQLSRWSFETLLLPQPLASLVIWTASLVLAMLWEPPFRREVWRGSHWLIFTQLLFFPATITVGVIFPASGVMPNPVPNVAGQWFLWSLWYLSLATGCLWVYRMKKLCWFAASLVVLQEILVLSARAIAGMRVSGEWF